MSDSQTQSYSPAPSTAPQKRRSGVLVWLLVLLVAGAAFAAALWYAGGPDAISQLGGLVGSFIPASLQSSGGQKPASAPPAAVASATPVGALPAEAQQRMFLEQAESREALAALVGGRIASFELGTPVKTEASATVPLTAVFTDGSTISGVIHLKKYKSSWYFFSLTRDTTEDEREGVTPVAFDSGVVSTITQQQALPGTQEILTTGMLDGGYKTVKVEDVKMGPRTATIDVTLSDGSDPASKGRLVCISKTDGATTYWFVARFEKR